MPSSWPACECGLKQVLIDRLEEYDREKATTKDDEVRRRARGG